MDREPLRCGNQHRNAAVVQQRRTGRLMDQKIKIAKGLRGGAANAAVLRRAVRLDVALFLETERYARASAQTLEDVRIEAMRLVAENPSPFGNRLQLV